MRIFISRYEVDQNFVKFLIRLYVVYNRKIVKYLVRYSNVYNVISCYEFFVAQVSLC